MTEESNKRRIDSIYQMLFEMAAGNFTFKIENTGNDDELEGLIVLVNMVAEELRATVFHNGFINSHFAYQYLVQHTFILDQQFFIKSYSPDITRNMGFEELELLDKPFAELLSKDSLDAWNLIIGPVIWNPHFHQTFQLAFQSKKGLLIPSFCMVSRLLHSTKILISTVTIVIKDSLHPNPVVLNAAAKENPETDTKNYDAKLIQQLYDFILENLDTPLPTAKELSAKFGTNEHKLKDGFRHFFKTSIYQFYNDERLKRAHLLIQQSDVPLKSIADMTGFNLYSNFSKAFKKRFGYAPNQIVRNNPDIHINGEQPEA